MSQSRDASLAIANRYATAMFALGQEAGSTELLAEELAAIAGAIEGSSELAAALKNPLIDRARKADILGDLAAKAAPLTRQALGTVAEQGRADLLPAIAQSLTDKLAAEKGELVAEVTSARPLSAPVQKQIADALKRATGKDVQMRLSEDAGVLGGVSIRIGSLLLDATLSNALNHMRQELLAPTNA